MQDYGETIRWPDTQAYSAREHCKYEKRAIVHFLSSLQHRQCLKMRSLRRARVIPSSKRVLEWRLRQWTIVSGTGKVKHPLVPFNTFNTLAVTTYLRCIAPWHYQTFGAAKFLFPKKCGSQCNTSSIVNQLGNDSHGHLAEGLGC